MKISLRISYQLAVLLLLLLVGSSCNSSGKKAPFTASGKPLEMVAVLPAAYDTPALRDSIKEAFGIPVEILPQTEPMIKVMYTTDENFTSMFRSIRNIFYISIDPQMYTRPSVTIARDPYAMGQILIHAKAESVESLYSILQVRGKMLAEKIYKEELFRRGNTLQGTYSSPFARVVEDSIAGGMTINAPVELEYIHTGKNFAWASNMVSKNRMDLVVYSIPYTDNDTFTLDYLMNLRDSVMKANISGQYENSYMTTERRVTPQMRTFKFRESYRAEIRGLWAMENDMMGGPFVMHATLSSDNQYVVVAEAFVYNPGGKKKNLLLYDEASLYSLRPAGTDFTLDAETPQPDQQETE